jgi:hypothetical protein
VTWLDPPKGPCLEGPYLGVEVSVTIVGFDLVAEVVGQRCRCVARMSLFEVMLLEKTGNMDPSDPFRWRIAAAVDAVLSMDANPPPAWTISITVNLTAAPEEPIPDDPVERLALRMTRRRPPDPELVWAGDDIPDEDG